MGSNRKKYDLIFSLGAACSCAQTLISANLRQFSSPFDWLFGSDFVSRCKILTSDFERFLEEKDLEYSHSERSISCDAYYNRYNDLTFNHDFEAKKELKETFPQVKEKYNRRINRLLQKIQEARTILIVYIETPDIENHSTNKEILSGWRKIHQKYPDKKIDLLYLINDNKMNPKQSEKENLSENVIKIVANYKSRKPNALPHSVNNSILVRLFSRYYLNIPFSQRAKRYILTYGIRCIPLKFLRKSLRRKYHVK